MLAVCQSNTVMIHLKNTRRYLFNWVALKVLSFITPINVLKGLFLDTFLYSLISNAFLSFFFHFMYNWVQLLHVQFTLLFIYSCYYYQPYWRRIYLSNVMMLIGFRFHEIVTTCSFYCYTYQISLISQNSIYWLWYSINVFEKFCTVIFLPYPTSIALVSSSVYVSATINPEMDEVKMI